MKQFGQAVTRFVNPASVIIFIEKRWSSSASLQMLCILRSLGRTNNVFLTKMDALLPETYYE